MSAAISARSRRNKNSQSPATPTNRRREICREKRTRDQESRTAVHLLGGNPPAGVVLPDGVDESADAGAAAAAPEEVVAGGLDEELVLAWRDGRRDERLRVRHVAVGGGVGEPGADGAVDAEDEEDEDERGEELQRRRPPVPPGERHVLAEQGPVLLPGERPAAEELHGRRRGSRGILGRTSTEGLVCGLGIYKGGV